MSSVQKVLILGASGSLGQALIPALIQAEFTVTILLRPGSKTDIANIEVGKLTADYSDVAELTKVFEGQDAVVEAFNPSASVHQNAVVSAAIAAGVKHLITPEFGLDTFNEHIDEVLIYEPKRTAQKELKELLAKSDSLLSWTAIIPGAWYDWAIETGQSWIDPISRTITRFGSGNQAYSMTRLSTVAEAVAAVLRNPEGYKNRPVYIANHTITTNRLIGLIEQLDPGNWKVVDVPVDGIIKAGRELWEQDTANGVTNRLQSKAYPMLGTAAIFDEHNRYGVNFGTKIEQQWKENEEALLKDLERLLK